MQSCSIARVGKAKGTCSVPMVEPRTDINGVKMTSEMKSNEFPKCRTGCPILSVELGFNKCELIQKSKDSLYSFRLVGRTLIQLKASEDCFSPQPYSSE